MLDAIYSLGRIMNSLVGGTERPFTCTFYEMLKKGYGITSYAVAMTT
jgi:hypothetical protein